MIQAEQIAQASYSARDLVYIMGGFGSLFLVIVGGFVKINADNRKTLNSALNGQSKERHSDIIGQVKEIKTEIRTLSDRQKEVAFHLTEVARINGETATILRSKTLCPYDGDERRCLPRKTT